MRKPEQKASGGDMKKPVHDNTGPMKAVRKKKREAGLRPVEIWVHTSVPKKKIKAAERRLQKPVNTD